MFDLVKVGKLVAAATVIGRIVAAPLPSNIALRLKRIHAFLREEAQFFSTEQNALILKYGEADPKIEGQFNIKPHMKGWLPYVEALGPVMEEEVTFPFPKFDVKDLPDLSANEADCLDFMLTGEEAAPAEETAALAARAAARKARADLKVVPAA